MAELCQAVMSPSLIENLPTHPVSPRFSLGMEQWTESYLKSIDQNLSGQGDCDQTDSCSSSECSSSSLRPPNSRPHPQPTFKHVLLQPHPQDLAPPPKQQKKRFHTLSNEELERLSTPTTSRNTEAAGL